MIRLFWESKSIRITYPLLIAITALSRFIILQGKGIDPDIIVEQGNFEAREFNRISEADLKDSLDKDEQKEKENLDSELSPQEERLLIDFQLSRAVDLIKGLSIYKESLIE